MLAKIAGTVFHPKIANRAALRRYMASVTLFAWIVAATADAVQHALTQDGLTPYLMQSAQTLFVVLAVALPLTRSMGLAHLNLHLTRLEAERLSLTDPLTGLANRRAFYAGAADRRGGVVALAIADIDRFKRINDQHGHAAGDAALTAVAHVMRDALSDLGMVARLGGEEFGLLSGSTDFGSVRERLETFRQQVAGMHVVVDGQAILVTVSIGCACGRDTELDALYSAADRALYSAKASGRDRVVAFEEIEPKQAVDSLRQAS